MSRAQDIEVGDGTTSVVVIAGALLHAAHRLVQKGIHPNVISRSFGRAAGEVERVFMIFIIFVFILTPLSYLDSQRYFYWYQIR